MPSQGDALPRQSGPRWRVSQLGPLHSSTFFPPFPHWLGLVVRTVVLRHPAKLAVNGGDLVLLRGMYFCWRSDSLTPKSAAIFAKSSGFGFVRPRMMRDSLDGEMPSPRASCIWVSSRSNKTNFSPANIRSDIYCRPMSESNGQTLTPRRTAKIGFLRVDSETGQHRSTPVNDVQADTGCRGLKPSDF
jgi:hypothetical protein